ncbi:MAG: hypothetical protein M1820_004977 [Bogoriella megaspora]|nr:MAG: hypothetical protein M1820_004977 [Bogoriella megaspora]
MSTNPYLLTSLPNDGSRGYRVEIDEFVEDNAMTNLFLIALSNVQADSLQAVKDDKNNDIPNWLNFYSAASIHGLPTENWNGIQNPALEGYGYCHHGLDTFPIWHRPYMAFYESIVYKEMARVAELYPTDAEKSTYRAAAARFRLPFWDIVMPRNEQSGALDSVWGTPAILAANNVYVKLPEPTSNADGGFDTIPNPLYSFFFPTDSEREEARKVFGRGVLDMHQSLSNVRTVRVPSKDAPDATNDSLLNLAIQRQAGVNATALIQMLNPDYTVGSVGAISRAPKVAINEVRNWAAFANHSGGGQTKVDGRTYPTVSVESFHDGIHNLLGTGGSAWDNDQLNRRKISRNAVGHMGNPTVASYDPIFWLHHNNVERLLCLHQAIYPDKYLDDGLAGEDLVPFLHENGDGSFWKSTDKWIKNYWNSGFAIPGATEPQADFKAIKAELKKYLAETYLWAANNTPHSLKNWPRNLSGSWALYGPSAAPVSASAVHVSALTIESGHAQLVHREVAFAVADPSDKQDASTPIIQDTTVKAAEVLELTNKINKSLVAGALQDLTEDQKPTYQITWNAHVKVRKYAFDGSFNVHLFVGHVKDDQPERYVTKKNEAGFTGVFSTPQDNLPNCSNCVKQRQEDVSIEDTIPLTAFLYNFLTESDRSDTLIPQAQKKTIDNLTPEEVVPFLKENLQWRITDLATNLLNVEQQVGLEILVSHRTYLAPDQGHLLGQYGPFVPHPEITVDRPGGWRYVYPTT